MKAILILATVICFAGCANDGGYRQEAHSECSKAVINRNFPKSGSTPKELYNWALALNPRSAVNRTWDGIWTCWFPTTQLAIAAHHEPHQVKQ